MPRPEEGHARSSMMVERQGPGQLTPKDASAGVRGGCGRSWGRGGDRGAPVELCLSGAFRRLFLLGSHTMSQRRPSDGSQERLQGQRGSSRWDPRPTPGPEPLGA